MQYFQILNTIPSLPTTRMQGEKVHSYKYVSLLAGERIKDITGNVGEQMTDRAEVNWIRRTHNAVYTKAPDFVNSSSILYQLQLIHPSLLHLVTTTYSIKFETYRLAPQLIFLGKAASYRDKIPGRL